MFLPEKLTLALGLSRLSKAVLLHHEIFVRSWIDTGFLESMRRHEDIEILVPRFATEVKKLLNINKLDFREVDVASSWILKNLGRLQWVASTRKSPSLQEVRRRLLFGDYVVHKGLGVWDWLNRFMHKTRSFAKQFFAAPAGTILALVPLGKITLWGLTYIFERKVFSSVCFNEPVPDVLFLPTAGFEDWMAPLIAHCRRSGSITILIPDNWDNLTSKNSILLAPDAIVTMGPSMSENLSKFLRIDSNLLHALGLPKFSQMTPPKRMLGGASSPKEVLFLGFSVPYLETTTLNGVYDGFLKLGLKVNLSYKPHPARIKRLVAEEPINPNIRLVTTQSKYALPELDKNYLEFLNSFDIVIGPPTTMLLEFIAMGRAQVILDLVDDFVHRTAPRRFADRFIHVRDLEPLCLMSGSSPLEIAEIVSGLTMSVSDNRGKSELVITPDASSYSEKLLSLGNSLLLKRSAR